MLKKKVKNSLKEWKNYNRSLLEEKKTENAINYLSNSSILKITLSLKPDIINFN